MADPRLAVVLAPEQLAELADLVVARLMQTALPPETYDQDTLPPGISRRVYLEASRAGEVTTSKIGRRVIATRSDLDRWMEARRTKPRTPAAPPTSGPPANDTAAPEPPAMISPALAAIIEANGARLR